MMKMLSLRGPLHFFFQIHMPTDSVSQLLVRGLSIVLIDLLLAGDNALVIAIAVRSLPQRQRRIAIACGAAVAVALRIGITTLAMRLLTVEFLEMTGGALVVWIAVKVLTDAGSPKHQQPAGDSLFKAIRLIVFADITMSIDNVLAVAGAARGSVPLIVFGLCVSIPFVVFASNLIAAIMDRYAVVVYLGAAILGKVGAEMILADPFVLRTLNPSQTIVWTSEGLAVAGVLAAGKLLSRRAASRQR
jgi:YjbE family integral membrane protein